MDNTSSTTATTTAGGLAGRALTVAFDRAEPVLADLDITLAPATTTAIIGPNGSGKSTLLRTLGRLQRPQRGTVLLDGADVSSIGKRDLARRLGVLPQAPQAPEALTVVDLVARGRDPHRRWYDQWAARDEHEVHRALERTGMLAHAATPLAHLSGGQRQRAWIAMALAQQPSTLLLDEPTTHLDVAHQLDVLDLLAQVHAEDGTTVVMVLHDLGCVARYAERVIALAEGAVVADGTPGQVITPEVLRRVFDVEADVIPDPVEGHPVVLPRRRRRRPDE